MARTRTLTHVWIYSIQSSTTPECSNIMSKSCICSTMKNLSDYPSFPSHRNVVMTRCARHWAAEDGWSGQRMRSAMRSKRWSTSTGRNDYAIFSNLSLSLAHSQAWQFSSWRTTRRCMHICQSNWSTQLRFFPFLPYTYNQHETSVLYCQKYEIRNKLTGREGDGSSDTHQHSHRDGCRSQATGGQLADEIQAVIHAHLLINNIDPYFE